MDRKPNPQVIQYALKRSGKTTEDLKSTYHKINEWLDGTWVPTFKQMCNFSKTTNIPVRYLYQDSVPNLGLKIPDFRVANQRRTEPSANLYDVINEMNNRQNWLCSFYKDREYEKAKIVGSMVGYNGNDLIKDSVDKIREYFEININWFDSVATFSEARKHLKTLIESKGVSVSIYGVVPGNTHRPLSVDEFRGFVISDEYAPLIFINGKDYLNAQIFTLIHEIAHLLFAETGVDSVSGVMPQQNLEEQCDKIAAELLVPSELIDLYFNNYNLTYKYLSSMANKFRVSFIVCARRLLEVGLISREVFFSYLSIHNEEVAKAEANLRRGDGGNPYHTAHVGLGDVLTDAIFIAVKTGDMSYSEAYEMTKFSGASFKTYFSKFVGDI